MPICIIAYALVIIYSISGSSVTADKLEDACYPVVEPMPLMCRTSHQCKENEYVRDSWNHLCFNGICTANQSIHCVDREQYGGKSNDNQLYYCADRRMCDAGTMDHVTYNPKRNNLCVHNIECPKGFYQRRKELCNKTCHNRHREPPSHVIIVCPGNATDSAIGMCNISEGYFYESPGNKVTFFSIIEHPDPCVYYKYSEYINCSRVQDFCANGSCTGLCKLGQKRDPCDCGCKPLNGTICSSPQFNFTTNKGLHVVELTDLTSVVTTPTTAADLTIAIGHRLTEHTNLIIGVISVLSLLFASGFVIWYIITKRTCTTVMNPVQNARRINNYVNNVENLTLNSCGQTEECLPLQEDQV